MKRPEVVVVVVSEVLEALVVLARDTTKGVPSEKVVVGVPLGDMFATPFTI